jgi:alpha-galactosidase
MIKLDSQLCIQIGDLASAQVELYHGSDNLLNGNLKQVEWMGTSARGTYALTSGAILQLELALESIAPDATSVKVTLTNVGSIPLGFDRFNAPRITLASKFTHSPVWTLQGAAVFWGQDFAFELPRGFYRDNFLGHLQDGEGGGIPVVYFWNKAQGMALMHIEPAPKDWYMPVKSDKEGITTALQLRQPITLQPGENFIGLQTIISLHMGDFFAPLTLYRKLLADQGIHAPQSVPANYEPAWCSWGYEFDVTPDEMTGVLPVLKELGIQWLTLDDRWFDAYADWNPRKDTFPNGVEDVRRMNAEIHAAQAFSQLWWYPLCAEDGHGGWESHKYGFSQVLKEHPDWVILNADGSVARNNRHLAMLCPALPEVREYTADLTRRFITEWGFDGHKLDNIFTIPPCYNPAHQHNYPEQSTEAMAEAYKSIFDLTRQLRPDSVTQICPCGTPLSLQLIPYTDQAVTADPTSSEQIRQRIKFYKALMGPCSAVFADHVELSDGGVDFASEIGTGGVPATKFIWPDDELVKARLHQVWNLSAEKKATWQRWFGIYNEHRPAQGEYLNLYDLAFDTPETHVIRKGGDLYYAFYTQSMDQTYSGRIQLRGLEASKIYRVWDYVNDREIVRLDGANPVIHIKFKGALLVEAREVECD